VKAYEHFSLQVFVTYDSSGISVAPEYTFMVSFSIKLFFWITIKLSSKRDFAFSTSSFSHMFASVNIW
jgi:hypothetical protein